MTEETTVPVASSWTALSGRYGRAVARACDLGIALVVLVAAGYYDAEYDLLLGGLMALCLLARRRFPGTVTAVVLALGVVQFVLYGLPDLPLVPAPASYDVAVLFAMMSVSRGAEAESVPGQGVRGGGGATGLSGRPESRFRMSSWVTS
ncbi:hypothetical protein ACFWMX_11755 [Streptomyces sp. NPDC058378]|uniref:hypothetical protein n=1 Tax=Streptomyces sp. NPDC058378 TaxID=3346469 RepID=UPI0036679CCA